MAKNPREYHVDDVKLNRRDVLASVGQVHSLLQDHEEPVLFVGTEDLKNLLCAAVLWLEHCK